MVGVWRSGTSLLYSLLNQHPDIGLLYEGELPLLSPLFWAGHGRGWVDKWELWNQAPSRHKMTAATVAANLHGLRRTCESVYKAHAFRKNASIWGDKIPSFHDRLPYLAGLFPNTRFILIWRSPLGICSSISRAARTSAWNAKWGLKLRALMGVEEMRKGRDLLLARGVSVHDVSFDDLTTDPEATLRVICNFLEIRYVPEMALLDRADRSAIYTGEHHHLVKSTNVENLTDRSEALLPEFKRKVERYMVLWRRVYGADWPPVSRAPEDELTEPSFSERVLDRTLYFALRISDSLVVFAFCFVPVRVWKAYRRYKAKRRVGER